jgi:hypothetical protein
MPSESTSPNHFARVLAAFDGRRYPLDARSSKVLRLMLEHPEGCDAELRSDRFEIVLGWSPARRGYYLATGPAVASYILDLASAADGSPDVQAVIGPAVVSALEAESWSFDARRVWLSRSWSTVRIAVRRAEVLAAPSAPLPFPEPIDFPPPSFIELASAFSCPACGAMGNRFRRLMDGYLVCSACGGSFQAPSP